jgi:hypothetical protein
MKWTPPAGIRVRVSLEIFMRQYIKTGSYLIVVSTVAHV